MAGRELRTKRSEKLTPEQLARIPQLMLEASTQRKPHERVYTPEKIAAREVAADRNTKNARKVQDGKRKKKIEAAGGPKKRGRKPSAMAKKYISGGYG